MDAPTCQNCFKQCGRNQYECQEHVYSPGIIDHKVTKCDIENGRIQYEGKWWNGPLDWLSRDIWIIKRAREMFE